MPHLLATCRHRLRRALLAQALALVWVRLALWWVPAVVADLAGDLPLWLRLGLFLVGLLASVVAVRRVVPALVASGQPREIARFIEARLPELDGALLAALDRGGNLTLSQEQTQRLFASRALPRRLWAAAVAMLVVLLTLALPQGPLAWQRLLWAPHAPAWPRQDALRLEFPRSVVAEDQGLQLHAQRLLGSASVLTLQWEAADGRRGRLEMPWNSQGLAQPQVQLERGRYQIIASTGDSLPEQATVAVWRRPELRAMQVRLSPPGYTGLPEQTLSAPPQAVLPGSQVEWQFTVQADGERQVRSVTARLGQEPVSVEPGPSWWTVRHPMGSSEQALVIEAEDEDGLSMLPLRLPLALGVDQPPRIRLEGLHDDEQVIPGAQLSLQLIAEDDYGLAQIAWEQAPSAETPSWSLGQAWNLTNIPQRLQRAASVAVPPQAAPGSRLLLRATAVDTNTVSGPGRAVSPVLSVRVVDEPALRRELERLIAQERDRLDNTRARYQDTADGAEAATATRRIRAALAEVERRWQVNQQDASGHTALEAAQNLLQHEVLSRLPRPANAGERQMVADGLRAAWAQLDGLLGAGDLRAELGKLIEQQQAVNERTKRVLRDELLGQSVGEAVAATADEQSVLAERLSRWSQQAEAQAGALAAAVARDAAATQLHEAARALAQGPRRQDAVAAQQQALSAMRAWWDQLGQQEAGAQQASAGNPGEQQQHDALVEQLRVLAQEHQALTLGAESGGALPALGSAWDALGPRLQALRPSLRERSQAADGFLGLAAQARAGVAPAVQAGARSAAVAAMQQSTALVVQALQTLNQQSDPQADDGDMLSLLRKLRATQAALRERVQQLAEAGFRAQESLREEAQAQGAIAQTLSSQVLPLVGEQLTVQLLLQQAQESAQRAAEYLTLGSEPALINDLQGVVIARIDRVLAAAELPSDMGDRRTTQGQGGAPGAPQSERPAYPDRALIALLRDEQARLARSVMLGVDAQALAAQDRLMQQVEQLLGHLRDGTRPAQLVERTHHAMELAVQNLVRGKDEPLAAAWQRQAVGELEKLLSEAALEMPPPSGGGGGSSGKPSQQQQAAQQQGSAAQGQEGEGQQGASQAGNGAVGESQAPAWLLRLPPAQRAQLDEAKASGVPDEGIELWRRSLDVLQEGLP